MPKAYWITEKSKLLLEAIDAKLLCLNANGDLPDAEMEKFEKFWNALLLRGIVKEPCDKPGKVFGSRKPRELQGGLFPQHLVTRMLHP